jgi:hypothetical protein
MAWPRSPAPAPPVVTPLAVVPPALARVRRRLRVPVAVLAGGVLVALSLALSLVLPPVGLVLGRAYGLFGLTGRRIGAICHVAAMLGVCLYVGLFLLAPDVVTAAFARHSGLAGSPLESVARAFQNVDAIMKQVAGALQSAL